MEKQNEPIRARPAVVDSLLADKRQQVGKLLDLYGWGTIHKPALY
jgi:hypothetical protein